MLPTLTRILISIAPLVFSCSSVGTWAGETGVSREYVVFSSSSPIGHMKSLDTGVKLVSELDIKNNGRGPTSRVEYSFDGDGALTGVRMTGKAWFGAGISERFSVSGGKAKWTTTTDRGERRLDPGVSHHYLTNEFAPDDLALLAARARPGGNATIALLPQGEARVERLGNFPVNIGGGQESVELYTIAGVEMAPNFVWLGQDGRLFAALQGSFAIIRSDAVPQRAELEQLQAAAESELSRSLAAALSHTPSGLTAIRNVAAYDPGSGRSLPRATVFIHGQRISAIHEGDVEMTADTRIVDGGGGTLIPGLWDMHVHLSSRWDGMQHLASGVTSVRNLGTTHEYLERTRKAFADGSALGPHVIASGFIEGKSETNANIQIVVESQERALDAVEWYARHGYRAIKIYNSIRPEWVRPMVDAAHARGMHVSGHIPAFMRARDAVNAGYDEINHINMLFLNFVLKDGEDTRTTLRFSALGERAAGLDLESAEVQAFIAELKRRDIVVDPTVAVFYELLVARDGVVTPVLAPFIDRLPAAIARGAYRAVMPIDNAKIDRTYKASGEKLLEMVGRLHDAGIRLVPGTDGWPGIGLIRELQFYVDAGIPAADVMRIATIGSAEVAGEAHDRGSIDVGKIADLVVLDGNPIADMRALERVRLVISEGRVMEGPALVKAVGMRPFGL